MVLAVGTRLQDFTTGSWALFKSKPKLIQLNVAAYDAWKHNALPLVGDASRLLSVLENLLDNAVKATAPGGRIELRTGPRPGLSVCDDGVGIPREALARIFEPGVSLVPGGFGLGLSLCREIVRRHGGRIEVDSRPGRTRFRVQLPPFHVPGEDDARDGLHPAG